MNKYIIKCLEYRLRKCMPAYSLIHIVLWKYSDPGFLENMRESSLYSNTLRRNRLNYTNTAGGSLIFNPLQRNRLNCIRFFSAGSLLHARKSTTNKLSRNLYKNVYEGRGISNPEPFWAKSNGCPISMFGASWRTMNGPTTSLPIADPKIFYRISDPYNNRNKIHEVCKGMRVVYIWTYKPKGFCLVGSSSNSVERILNYFSPKRLLSENRRAMEFFSVYGFKNVDLYIIPLSPKKYTVKDMKLLEAYYIQELHTPLNVQRKVYISPYTDSGIKGDTTNSGNLESLSELAVPVYVFKKDNLKRVLYVFSSLTQFKKEFQISASTLKGFLNQEDKVYLDCFIFTTKLPKDSDLNNLIGIDELLKLKHSISPKKYYGKKAIELIDVKNPEGSSIIFESISSLIEPLNQLAGEKVYRHTVIKYAESGAIFKERWLFKFVEASTPTSVKGNLNKDISSSTSYQSTSVNFVDGPEGVVKGKINVSSAISVEVTDLTNNIKLVFSTLKEAAKHIKNETGKGSPEGLKYALDKGTAFLNMYLVKEIVESYQLKDLSTNDIKYFRTLKEVSEYIKDIAGICAFTGLHWSYKNKKAYRKRFVVEKVKI